MKRFALNKPTLSRYPMPLLILLVFSLSLAACGGSGGSGDNSPGASYTGVRTQAVITDENYGALIDESFEGAVTSDAMVPFGVPAGQASDNQAPLPIKLKAAFNDSLADVLGAPDQRGAMANASETISGSCGGSATYQLSYNEESGAFSGSFNYNAFCEGGVTLSGSANFSGRVNTSGSGSIFDYFTFTFTNMATTADGVTSTINGSLECDFIGSDVMITADIVVADSSTGLICWLNNYNIQVGLGQMEISGRYYDQVHGYIDFETVEPLVYIGSNEYPSSGLVRFTGAAGSLAELHALSDTQCQVLVDYDGVGVWDYDSGPIAWTEL